MRNEAQNLKFYREYKNYFSKTNPDQTPMSFIDFVDAHNLDSDNDGETDVNSPSHPIHY